MAVDDKRNEITAIPKLLQILELSGCLVTIGMTFNQTTHNGKQTVEARSYILSKKLTARRFTEAVRGHWSIENQLH